MRSFCKVDLAGITIGISQTYDLPVIVIRESYGFGILKRNLAVNIYRSGGDLSSCVILTPLDVYIIVAVLFDNKIPLDPLSRSSPGFTAGIVENGAGNAVRLSGR